MTKSGKPDIAWLYGADFVKSPSDHDTSLHFPAMMGNAFVKMKVGDEEVFNPFQKPQLLFRKLVERYSPPHSVIADFTAGSGTLAATCASYPELHNRSGMRMLW